MNSSDIRQSAALHKGL